MISLRNPARTRQDNERLARGLGGSAAVHVLFFLFWIAAPAPATPKLDALRTYPLAMTAVEVPLTDAAPAFSDIPGPAQAAAGGADSEGGPAGEAPPSEAPVPERVTPPATAPVRAPRPDVRREGRPVPAPVPPARERPRPSAAPTRGRAQPAPAATGANRPVERQGTGTQAGTGQGVGAGAGRGDGGGSGSGAGSGEGSGSGGTAAVEVGFALGNRTYDCPTPPFDGVPGQVTLTVTFSPDGRYISSRPRGGNADLVRAASSVVSRCRAQRLPAGAAQTSQSTQATFRFVAS